MILNFILNPHTRNIIIGRRKSLSIICSAKNCGKEIIVTGYVKCNRCSSEVHYPDDLVDNTLICPTCHKDISLKNEDGEYTVIWTQKVVSKHRHSKHNYYHEDHWNAMQIVSKDED
jgi:acetyl-CoA carboxylase beta subunit